VVVLFFYFPEDGSSKSFRNVTKYQLIQFRLDHKLCDIITYKVGFATTNECYDEQFVSIKSGCYNEHRCYNERGGMLSADVARACA